MISRFTRYFCMGNLRSTIEKAIMDEEQKYTENESLERYLMAQDFEMTEDDSYKVVLKKTVKDFNAEIAFISKIYDYKHEPEEQKKKELKEKLKDEFDDDDEDDPYKLSSFDVAVRKNGQSKGLIFQCISKNGEVNVANVAYSDDVDTSRRRDGPFGDFEYQGPDFFTLDEKLQNAFLGYLKQFSVEEDLGLFIEEFTEDKKKRMYISWLKKTKDFLKINS